MISLKTMQEEDPGSKMLRIVGRKVVSSLTALTSVKAQMRRRSFTFLVEFPNNSPLHWTQLAAYLIVPLPDFQTFYRLSYAVI